YGLEYVDVASFAPDPDILKSVPVELMFRYNFLPYRREKGRLVLVMADPTDIPVVDELSLLLQTPIQPAVGTPPAIGQALKRGEDAVIRILDKESLSEQFTSLRLDVLGFDEKELARFRRFIREPYGMVLVTGPTGSGKTTTLYAALSEIKSEEDKIITIEDPVEYQIRGITQIPVNEKKGLTFARGLRSILRHDPDKIMVGEIRDNETAQIAIQSALTGHLVFTTVHANNVVDVLGRF